MNIQQKHDMIFNRFTQARATLQNYVVNLAEELMEKHNIKSIRPTQYAPSTFEMLLDEMNSASFDGTFRVYSGGMDFTIYNDAHGNHCFRFVHDMKHLELNRDFSFAGEVAVAKAQIAEADAIYGKGSDVSLLLEIDTLGQLLYFHNHDKFVDNQLEFAWEKFQARYSAMGDRSVPWLRQKH